MKISNKKMINGNMRNKDNWVVNLSNKNLSEDLKEEGKKKARRSPPDATDETSLSFS